MRRFELGMSLDYVSNWSIVDAVREVFQNSLDEEIQNPDNKWYFDYNEESQILKIGNKLSRLSTHSLLLGCSTKRNDKETIGQHGEGYKVATIVLLRSNCGVKIYNYNEKEIWTAKIIKSRRYDAEIGVFDVDKMGVFKSVPEQSLIFEITNISKEVYEQIKERNLWLQDNLGDFKATPYGKVLLDERFLGKVYVKGLYVCTKEQLTYGYDLAPSLIELDRDRGLVDSFNLQYRLGKLLISLDDIDFIDSIKDTWDGYYIRCFSSEADESIQEVYERSLKKFIEKYGEDARPCTSTDEFNRLKRFGYNVVMVNFNEYYYISNAKGYKLYVDEEDTPITDELQSWFEECRKYIPKHLVAKGSSIIEDIIERL